MAKKAADGGNVVGGENTIYKVSSEIPVLLIQDYKLTMTLGDV